MEEILSEKLIQKLIARKLLTREKLEQAKREVAADQSLSEFLLERGWMDKLSYLLFLSEEFHYPVFNPQAFNISPEVLGMIPVEFVQRHQVLPVSFHDETLTVAMSNPADILVLDDLRALTGKSVMPVIALSRAIREAIQKFYTTAELDQEESMQELIKVAMEKQGTLEGEQSNLVRLATETPVIKITNALLIEGIRRRASDVFIEPWEKTMRVRCRVDGQLEEIKGPPRSMAEGIVSRVKVMSNLNIAERRLPQDGRFRIKAQDRMIDMRVSIIPTNFGEKVCLRILDKTVQTQNLEKLGFHQTELDRIGEAIERPHGMILITGPTGSGKTSTLYAMLNRLDSPTKNITTVEDPVEYKLDGINQVQVNDYVGLTFGASLRSILRQDPDIVMIGEIRDVETLNIAIKAALTGHLVLSTLHTNDAASSIVRMTNMGIEPFLISSSVIMLSAQRLVRRLCPSCREPYEASAQIKKDLRLPENKTIILYKPMGCNLCRHTGFQGRTVITEVLPLSQKINELILNKSNGDVIKWAAREEGMATLRESGIRKAVLGETTLEEVFRVAARDRDMARTLEC